MGWFWPEIYDRDTAQEVARRGAWVALLVAALTGLLALLSLALRTVYSVLPRWRCLTPSFLQRPVGAFTRCRALGR